MPRKSRAEEFRRELAARGRRQKTPPQQPTTPPPLPMPTKNELIEAYLRGEHAGPVIVRESWGSTDVETKDYDTSPSTLWDASCEAMRADVRKRIGVHAGRQPEGLRESFIKGAEAAAKACLSTLCDEHPLDRCGEEALGPFDGTRCSRRRRAR